MRYLQHIPDIVMCHITTNIENEPLYLYDTEAIKQHCHLFRTIPYTHISTHFASMANSNPAFLSIVRNQGLNIFVNSIDHLFLVQKVGFTGREIIFTASALNPAVMKRISQSNAFLNLDSVGQIQQWLSLFPDRPVGIRCNIGERVEPKKTRAGHFLGSKSRLGLTLKEIYSLKGHPLIQGLHFYAGTDILDINYFMDCYRIITELVPIFPHIEYVNLGGGFGVDDSLDAEFDMGDFGIRLTHLMDEVCAKMGRPLHCILEPGRIIGCSAGYFVCWVTDVKIRGDRQFIGVNASSVQFPRPLLYPDNARHPLCLIRNNAIADSTPSVLSSVYGCSTYSRDFLAHEVFLPSAQLNDCVVFGNAGSYCASAHSRFLGFAKPREIFL